MATLAWWDNESLWESDAADTVSRPTEDAAFDRIRTQCHDYITAMQRMYSTLDYGIIRDIVLNKRASLDIFVLIPVERDAVWGRARRWLWEAPKRNRPGYYYVNPEWSEAAGL